MDIIIKYEEQDIELTDDYEDSDIFKSAIPSQYQSVLYTRLKKDRRLDDFLRILKACALSGKTLRETCEVLSKMFRGYVRKTGISPDMLNKMRNRYKDIDKAMGFSSEYALLGAYERASELASKTDNIEESIRFIDRFDSEGMFTRPVEEENKSGVNVNINNNYSSQTQDTENLILESLRSIELTPSKGEDTE